MILNRLFYCKKLFPKRRILIFRYKIKVMTWLTFFIATLTVFALGFVVAKFWVELAVFFIVMKTILTLALISGVSALLWIIFADSGAQGWQRLWMFFFLGYSTVVAVFVSISFDLIDYSVECIRSIFKIK